MNSPKPKHARWELNLAQYQVGTAVRVLGFLCEGRPEGRPTGACSPPKALPFPNKKLSVQHTHKTSDAPVREKLATHSVHTIDTVADVVHQPSLQKHLGPVNRLRIRRNASDA